MGQPESTKPVGYSIDRTVVEELRVELANYCGSDYISIRVWVLTSDGEWVPHATKGVSVKLRELDGVLYALTGIYYALRDACISTGETQEG